MLLVAMKHKSSWDQLAHMFQIKGLTFIRLTHGFMNKIYELCLKRLVQKYDERFSIKEMGENKQLFKIFPFCLETIDVLFQQADRPSGSI